MSALGPLPRAPLANGSPHTSVRATGFDGEVVRNVRMLERFTFVEVPEQETERVVAQLSGSEPAGRPVALEPVRG
jgi:ATP-dependent RNA helicase DeaD